MQIFVYGERRAMIPDRPAIRRGRLAKQRGGGKAESGESTAGDFRPANPDVIDQGVFHNDVIAVSNRRCCFAINRRSLASHSYWQTSCAGQWFYGDRSSGDSGFRVDAVSTYLFNSQLLNRDDGSICWCCLRNVGNMLEYGVISMIACCR